MEEIWKDVKDYEGRYKVSNLGRVKSLSRTVNAPRGRKLDLPEKILKQGKAKNYPTVYLYKEGVGRKVTVHKIVAEAFLDHTTCIYNEVVDHIDGDTTNNKLSNLQLLSTRENLAKGDWKRKPKYLKGVRMTKQRRTFFSIISIKGKRKYLGSFETEIEAHEAYLKALEEL